MDPRLTDLEIRYMHLERQVSELSEVVYEQQRLIERLRKEMLELRGRLPDEAAAPAEKPPHY